MPPRCLSSEGGRCNHLPTDPMTLICCPLCTVAVVLCCSFVLFQLTSFFAHRKDGSAFSSWRHFIYVFIFVEFVFIKCCCEGPCDEIRQLCLNKGWRVHNCRSYRSEVPGANCQSRANDDKCLSMQIAAAAAAQAGAAGCAAEGESRRAEKKLCLRRETVRAHF